MTQPTCSAPTVPPCPKPAYQRGWCDKHYSRWYRHGDPLYGEGQLPAGTCGVYSITCLANGWVYIGSSQSIRQRWSTHKSWLRNGTHNVPQLQADWDEHGEPAFVFEVVTQVSEAEARYDAEQEHIDAHWGNGKFYNLSPSARDNTGHRFTAAQGAKVSAALAGVPKSAEHRANIWANREVTPEFRAQMSENGKHLQGKPKSAETRAKMSATQFAGRPVLTEDVVREIKRLLAAGEMTGSAIARKFGLTPGAVSAIRTGRNWAHITLEDPAPPGALF